MKRALLWLALAVATGCTTPLAVGERLYREGDRLGALETWRAIPENSSEYAESHRRIEIVEQEFNSLVKRYKQRGRYFEANDQLAEAILDYRLALKLQPDDAESLAHVQQLARTVARRKADLEQTYRAAFAEGDLATARETLDRLRILDPFDPGLPTEERQLREELGLAVARRLDAGRRRFMSNALAAAELHFRSVLALDPDNESARGYLAYIETIQREREEKAVRSATFASQEGFATDMEIRAEGFHQNALAAEQEGNLFEAIRQDVRALEANAKHRGAREHLDEMRSRLSGSVRELIEAGRSAYGDEDLQLALELWSRAVLIDPDNERARVYVDRAQRQLQNLERLRSEPDVASKGE